MEKLMPARPLEDIERDVRQAMPEFICSLHSNEHMSPFEYPSIGAVG